MTAVLIVDDNAFVRTGLSELFAREPDFEVCGTAENGRAAIDEANRLHPDLIVLDLAMPVMNGLDAARALRQMMPNVPIIMYSATQGAACAQMARSVGISEVVAKSERVSVLIATARGLVQRRAA